MSQSNAAKVDLETFTLGEGKHASIEKGACIMEMVSYLANEPWSDSPQCACRVLTRMAVRLNDRFDTETRQKMKPLIPLLTGTRADTKTEVARAKFIVHRSITVTMPLLTDAIGLTEVSATLRAFGNSREEFLRARDYLRAQREPIRLAMRNAADAAYAAAAYAAYADAADAYAYAYADAYAYAYAAAYAYADAADAAADAAAYAAAYAASPSKAKWLDLRKQINDSSIETLRLACGVTS